MKVKDILEELEGVDPDTDVSFELRQGCCDDYESLDVVDFGAFTLTDGVHHVRLMFDNLPGYESCISTGQIKSFIKKRELKFSIMKTINKVLKGDKK